MAPERSAQEIQACFQSMQAMDDLYEEYARKNDLTYMSLYILETIYEQGSCTQATVSEATLYPKQTVNMVIRSFRKKDWVILEQDKTDRRNKYIKLTAAGEAFARQVIEPYWAAADNALGELQASDRSIMLRTLRAFTDSFAEKVRGI